MIAVTFFSKSIIDFVMFRFDFCSEFDAILDLEGKTIRNIEQQDDVVIAEL